MPNDAAVLAVTYTKLVNECRMAGWFCEQGIKRPLRDCLHRIDTVLGRVNRLLTSTASPSIVSHIVALNNLTAEDLRRAETGESAQWLSKALAMLLDMRTLFRAADKSGASNQIPEPLCGSAGSSPASPDIADGRQARASVVIPAYNMSATVWRAIESSLAQKLDGGFETIIVDDGSSDETRQVLNLYGGRIRTVLMPANRGLSAARNRGLAAARGKFIAFLDADDEFLPGRLADTVAPLEASPEAVLAYSDCLIVDKAGLIVANSLAPAMCASTVMRAPSAEDMFSGCWWPIIPTTVTARADVLQECGGFNEAFAAASGHEDVYTWFRARELGSFAFVNKPLAQYRLTPLLDRLEKYVPNTRVLHRLMRERYGARGANMVDNFAINMALALVGEGAAAMSRKQVPNALRALSCACEYLHETDFPESEGAVERTPGTPWEVTIGGAP